MSDTRKNDEPPDPTPENGESPQLYALTRDASGYALRYYYPNYPTAVHVTHT
jgi:hypothetical protein